MEQALEVRLAEYRAEKARKAKFQERVKQERRFLIPVFLFVALLFPNFGRVEVVGQSMEPTFESHDKLVMLKTYRLFAPLKEGDVVVIRKQSGKYAGEQLIKRVVFIQNAEGNAKWPRTIRVGETQWQAKQLFPTHVLGLQKVPKGQLLVVGDNLWNSSDSRDPDIGPISESEIIGKVLYR